MFNLSEKMMNLMRMKNAEWKLAFDGPEYDDRPDMDIRYGCTGGCGGNPCTSTCKGSCKNGCTRSCRGNSR